MNAQFVHYRDLLKSYWWIVALTTLGALSVSFFVSYASTPAYETQARFLVSPAQFLEDERDMIDSLETLDKRSTVATYAEVMGSTTILEAAGERLAVDSESLDNYSISTSILPEASIIELRITGRHPQLVAVLANTLGEQGIDYIRDKYRIYDINFLDRAQVPERPASPQPVRDAALAALLGLGIGVVAILLWDQLGVQPESEEVKLPMQPAPEDAVQPAPERKQTRPQPAPAKMVKQLGK